MIKKLINNKLLSIFSFFEGFLQVYGFLISKNKSITNFNILYIFVALLLGLVFLIINNIYFYILKKYNIKSNDKKFNRRRFILLSFIIFISWVPILLAFYPGIFSYDAYRQIPHFKGQNIGTFQPIFHTLIIEFFLYIGNKLSGYELGLLLYSLFQMLIMSLIFSYTTENILSRINNNKVRNISMIILCLFYGLFPVNSVLSISFTKDVLFSGILLLIVVTLSNFVDDNYSKKDYFILCISLLILLLIKNGLITLYFILFISSAIIFKGTKKKILTKIFIVSIVLYYISIISITYVFRPEKNYKIEKYSVPMYNLVYVASKHSDVANNDSDIVFDQFSRDCFYPNFNDYFKYNKADWAKESVAFCVNNDFSENQLMKTWIKNGIKYPVNYIDSTSKLNIGAWYFLDNTHTHIYSNSEYMSTDFKYQEIFKDVNFETQFKSLNNLINEFTRNCIQYKKLSVLRFIFQPATYIFIFIINLLYCIKYKKREELILYIPYLCVLLSVLVGPCILIRYIYPFIVSMFYLIYRNLVM